MDHERIEDLRSNKLFTSVPDEYIKEIIPHIKELTFSKDDFIFHHGEEDNRLYLLVQGCVGIYNPTRDGSTILLVEIAENDYFGELELLDGLPRSADAIAHTDVTLLRMPYDAFHMLLKDDSPLSVNIMQQLSLRLRRTNQVIAQEFEHHSMDRQSTRQNVTTY